MCSQKVLLFNWKYYLILQNKHCQLQSDCTDQGSLCGDGGIFQRFCNTTGRRFRCQCLPGYIGRFCATRARSCTDFLKHSENKPKNGLYTIFDASNITYPVYCDFDTEPGSSWTLVLSFALKNNRKDRYNRLGLYKNHPVSQEQVNWDLYRLSKARMDALKTRSANFRATCYYPEYKVDYRDYLRGECKTEKNILVKWEKSQIDQKNDG